MRENYKKSNNYSVIIKNSVILFLLFCGFHPSSLSSQIYICERTIVTETIVEGKPEPTSIYIAEGTLVTGLQPDQNLVVIHAKSAEKPKTSSAKRKAEKKENLTHIAREEKAVPATETYNQNNQDKNFLFSVGSSTAVVSAAPQIIKLLAIISVSDTSKQFYYEGELKTIKFSIIKVAAFLVTAKTRPPPVA